MQTERLSLTLIAHPAHPPLAVRGVTGRVSLVAHSWLTLRWRVEGSARLVVPPFAGSGLADDLWRTTCFELFCRSERAAHYTELNLSPSERWAAYDFHSYRKGMAARELRRAPAITPRRGGDVLILDAALRLADLPPLPWSFGLSAVLEEEEGRLSYWALAHREPDKPDFHDPACFTGWLAPADAP